MGHNPATEGSVKLRRSAPGTVATTILRKLLAPMPWSRRTRPIEDASQSGRDAHSLSRC